MGTGSTLGDQTFYQNCFNGIYRTNLDGKFNVPEGTRLGTYFSQDDLLSCSELLRKATLIEGDFVKTLKRVTYPSRVHRSCCNPRAAYGLPGKEHRSLRREQRARESGSSICVGRCCAAAVGSAVEAPCPATQ